MTVSESEVLAKLAADVDSALSAAQELDDETKKKFLKLKEALEAFHKEGLVSLVKAVKADERGKELLLQAMEEPSVYALFSMHGIIKPSLRARVVEVLEQVKPYLSSHGGDIELVDVEEEVVYVRLHGACAGCSMSAQTLRDAVEETMRTRLPQIKRVEQVTDMAVSGFLSIDQDKGWVEGPLLETIAETMNNGAVYCMLQESVLLMQSEGKLFAFRNACPHMGLPLDGGKVEGETITCPFHGFKFLRSTGECLTAPEVQLEPFPLKIVEGRIWVRPQ